MNKVVTSVTVFNDAVGMRMSATYSEIDDSGQIISDNKRFNKVIIDSGIKNISQNLLAYAQENIPEN